MKNLEVLWENEQIMFEKIYDGLIYRELRAFDREDKILSYNHISDVIMYEDFKRIIYKHLRYELKKMSQSLLVDDINSLREIGSFRETDYRAQYREYISAFFEKDRFAIFCGKHKLWTEKYKNCIKSFYQFIFEVCINYKKDFSYIQKEGLIYGTNQRKIKNLTFVGDIHNSGRCVVLCETEKCKLVYKPINGKIYELYAEMIRLVSGNQQFKTVKILPRELYLWSEYIEQKECITIEDIREFYRNSGYVLACCYILNAVDIHNENIVAVGKYPVLIDIETGMSTEFECDKESCGRRILEKSVFQTSLLPMKYDKRREGTCDCSGLGATGLVQYEINALENDFTSIVREYRKKVVEKDIDLHIPKLDGVEHPAWEYVDDIIEGFCLGYKNIRDHISDIHGIVDRYLDAEIRVVIRSTAVYVELLKRINMPDMLTNRKEVELFLLKFLGKNQINDLCTESEINQLISGDIPYFFMNINQNVLKEKNSDRYILNNMVVPKLKLFDKLERLSDDDQKLQCDFISIALNKEGYNTAFLKSKNMEKICDEIDVYIDRAEKNLENKDCYFSLQKNWKGQYLYDEMNDGIYEGYLGMYLYKFNQWDESVTLYCEMFKRIVRNSSWGIFDGYAALLLFLYNMKFCSNYEKEREVLKICEVINDNMPDHINVNNVDILDGVSGTIVVLNLFVKNVSKSTKKVLSQIIQRLAHRIVDLWERNREGILKVSGFAHGIAGIKVALYISYLLTKESIFKEVFWDMEKEDSIDRYRTLNWCNGIVGYFMSYYMLYQLNHKEEFFYNRLQSGVMSVFKNMFKTDDFCLCHGFLGAYDFLLLMREHNLLNIVQEKELEEIEWKIVETLTNRPICVSDISLYTGINGIRYIQKRLNEGVPSVLSCFY